MSDLNRNKGIEEARLSVSSVVFILLICLAVFASAAYSYYRYIILQEFEYSLPEETSEEVPGEQEDI